MINRRNRIKAEDQRLTLMTFEIREIVARKSFIQKWTHRSVPTTKVLMNFQNRTSWNSRYFSAPVSS